MRISDWSSDVCSSDLVAGRTVELARQGCDEYGLDHPRAHVGYYLIDVGIAELERDTGARLSWTQRMLRLCHNAPLLCYLSPVILLTAVFCAGLLWQAHYDNLPKWTLIGLAALAIIAGSQLAIALTNWLITLRETPKPLPRMDFSNGIPSRCTTLVAVPSMLFTAQTVDQLCEALDVRSSEEHTTELHLLLT